MKSIFLIGLLALLPACVKITDADEPDSRQPPASSESQNGADSAKGSNSRPVGPQPVVQALPEAMKYKVLLPVPAGSQVIQRKLHSVEGENVPTLLPIVLKDGAFIDENVESGKDYDYELGVIHEGEMDAQASYSVHIPKDFVINSEIQLTADAAWTGIDGRFFLTSQGVITTNGFNLWIEIDALVSDGGMIRSFRSGFQAQQGSAGRSGGSVRIQARTARGKITMEMRGQHGGLGLKGKDWVSFQDNSEQEPGGPVNGMGRGIKGGRGGDGYRGGNSGNFEMKISEAHSLTIYRTIETGVGGFGGPGGKGSPQMHDAINMMEGSPGDEGRPGAGGDREFSYLIDLSGRTAY